MKFTRRAAIFGLALVAGAANGGAVEIIAHRGASFDAPENTLAALRLGWEQGADANELDVHLSQDGRLVVLHDASTKRTAGVDQLVTRQSAAQLQQLDAGSWKDPRWKSEKIPTLDQALAHIPAGKRRFFIEIKCGPEALPPLKQVLQQSNLKPAQVVIIGFDFDTMAQAKQRFPQIPVFWLVSHKPDKKTKRLPTLPEMIERVKAARLDGLNLHYDWPIDAAFVRQVKDAQLQLYVWTVDDPAVARRLAKAGVDGLTTNRPAWLREQLAAAQP